MDTATAVPTSCEGQGVRSVANVRKVWDVYLRSPNLDNSDWIQCPTRDSEVRPVCLGLSNLGKADGVCQSKESIPAEAQEMQGEHQFPHWRRRRRDYANLSDLVPKDSGVMYWSCAQTCGCCAPELPRISWGREM